MTSQESISLLPKPPGSLGLPLIGESLEFFTDSDFAAKRHQKYGNVFKTSVFGRPTVFVRGWEAVQFILSNENRLFVASWPESTKRLLGEDSLPIQNGSVHQNRRKLLAQAFMPRALSSYIANMLEISQFYCQRWDNLGYFAWYPELRNCTLDIACKLLVGIDRGSESVLGEEFETWCRGLFTVAIPLPMTKFGKAIAARGKILEEIDTIVRQRQASSAQPTDALGLLLAARDEEGKSLPIPELKNQILNLLFAGHETLTSSLASFCLLLAQNPDILQRLREEVSLICPEGTLNLDILKEMTYLELVLKEVLRIVAPVGGGFRQITQDCDFQGYRFPQGWQILYGISDTHKLPELYSEPEAFNPDRFYQPKPVEQQKYGYIPFGGGVRECVGKEFARLEMKILAIALLRDYEWKLEPNQDLSMTVIPTPHPRDGLKVSFQKLGAI